jgi:hypothetical protein
VRAVRWHSFAPLTSRAVLDEPLTNAAVTSQDLPVACPATCPTYTIADAQLLPASREPTPLCSTTDVIPHAVLPDAKPYQANERVHPIPLRAEPLGCRFSPSDIALLDIETAPAARAACLDQMERRIVIQGDSHGRMLYDSLMPRLVGKGARPTYVRRAHL